MSESKKASLVVTVLGLVFIIAGVLTLFFAVKMTHYSATVTEITESYTTMQRSGETKKRRFNEKVSVEYVDRDGNEKTASNVRIKRSTESQLPAVGDTVQIEELFGVGEYSLTTPIAIFITFLFVGIALLISALRVRKQKKRAKR
ncbi:MAG: hypothetical protein K6C12_15055 [Oscillospiraceae bacterium]|nr:hypothetical protein [Oscillospiraceae bacterium]